MTCVHHEVITRVAGKKIGTCKWCGQVKQYDPAGHDAPIIIKEGNMGQEEIKQPEAVPYKKMSKGELHRFLKANKGKILEDVRLLGQKATRNKWGINSSTWCGLMHRWVPDHAPYTDVLINKASVEPQLQSPLPKLPEWNEDWSNLVKLAWLGCAQALMGVRKEDKNG